MSKSIAPVPDPYPAPPDAARSRVVIPSPAEPALQLVLTCGGTACGHTFEPNPLDFAGGRLSCPRCGGWAFVGDLVEPSAAGGVS
jgi:hypothetical protein